MVNELRYRSYFLLENILMPTASNKPALLTIFLVIMIDLMGFGIVLPLLPFYASQFEASSIQIGLLYSVFSMMQLVFSPIWGSISDHIGRKPVLAISTIGSTTAYILFGFSHSLTLLFISRILAGIMGGNVSAAQAYIADVTTEQDRTKGMGLIGAAFGTGFVIGPTIATLLISHPSQIFFQNMGMQNVYAVPGFFAAILSFTSLILILTKLKESKTHHITANNTKKTTVFTSAFWQFIFNPQNHDKKILRLLFFSTFLTTFGQSSLYSSFPILCQNVLSLSADHVGFFYIYMGLLSIFIQGGLIRFLIRKISEEKLFLIGSILMTTGIGLLTLTYSKNNLFLFLGIMVLGGSINTPIVNSLISKKADTSNMGTTLGTSQGLAGMGRMIGPTWAGILSHFSFRIPFILTAMILSSSIYAAFTILCSKNQNQSKLL